MHKIVTLAFLIILSTSIAKSQEKEYYIAVADSKVYVSDIGKGEPILLLHAGNMDHRMWTNLVDVLALNHRVLRMDIRGCGKTIDGDSTYLQSEAIRIVLDSLNIKKVTIVGSSLGSVSATAFGIAYPQCVRSLILTSPGLIGMPLNTDDKLIEYNKLMVSAYQSKSWNAYITAFAGAWVDGQRDSSEVNPFIRKSAVLLIRENVLKRKSNVWPGFSMNPLQVDKISELKMPILVITGNSDMKDIKSVASKFKTIGATVKNIDYAGHLVNMEMPGEYNAIVLNWIKNLIN